MDNDGTVTGFVINVDILQAGPDATLTMILHDAAHLLAWRREIADTTMRGAYHNREFLTVADEVGLRWPPHAPRGAGVGYADVELTEEARTRYADGLAALTEAIPLTLPHLELPKTTTGRVDRLTLKCQCDPPRSFRMSQTVAAQGPVICGVCGKEFTS
ncbi:MULTISPECIES: hypothetical protein [unclassified Streptomyces]|uniref:hypothetical protein n=1 Tax=unclassified Streptomyces TaxID=2593676 RepID=UPI003D723C29